MYVCMVCFVIQEGGAGGGLSETQISNSNPFDCGDNKCLWLKSTMGDKSVETKFDFRASWTNSPPPPPNNVDFSISWTAQTKSPTQH